MAQGCSGMGWGAEAGIARGLKMGSWPGGTAGVSGRGVLRGDEVRSTVVSLGRLGSDVSWAE